MGRAGPGGRRWVLQGPSLRRSRSLPAESPAAGVRWLRGPGRRAGRQTGRAGWLAGPVSPGWQWFLLSCGVICGFRLQGPSVGVLLSAGQAVSVRSRPKVAIVSCSLPSSSLFQMLWGEAWEKGTLGCRDAARDGRSLPRPTPGSTSPAWGRGESERANAQSRACSFSLLWHLQLAHGFVVFGFRLRDFNQPALLLGGRKSELYFSHWPEQKTEASAGVWEWFMGWAQWQGSPCNARGNRAEWCAVSIAREKELSSG